MAPLERGYVDEEARDHLVWGHLLTAVRRRDRFAAHLLEKEVGRHYGYSMRYASDSETAELFIYVGEGRPSFEDSLVVKSLKEMRWLLEEAARESNIPQISLCDIDQRLTFVLVDADPSWAGWEPSLDDLAQSAKRLKRLFPAERLEATPSTKVDGFMMTPIEVRFYNALKETRLLVSPQCRILSEGRNICRLDFLILYRGRAVAVELDGHESHKSRDARASDVSRDRYLHARSIQTIRFTGSQVMKDVSACIFELVDCLTEQKAGEI